MPVATTLSRSTRNIYSCVCVFDFVDVKRLFWILHRERALYFKETKRRTFKDSNVFKDSNGVRALLFSFVFFLLFFFFFFSFFFSFLLFVCCFFLFALCFLLCAFCFCGFLASCFLVCGFHDPHSLVTITLAHLTTHDQDSYLVTYSLDSRSFDHS